VRNKGSQVQIWTVNGVHESSPSLTAVLAELIATFPTSPAHRGRRVLAGRSNRRGAREHSTA